MGLFGASSPFDQSVEKATSEQNTVESWASIMEICDKVLASPTGPKDCLRSTVKRLNNKIPLVQMQALTLLDACVQNCGKSFHREIASRDFTTEARAIIKQATPKVVDKFKDILKKWSQNEFKSDPSLSIIPSFYNSLKSDFSDGEEGMKLSSSSHVSAPSAATASKEDEDLQKAIALSLKESSPKASALYPTMSSNQPAAASQKKEAKEPRKVRALYDFEAAEDNELTFKTGEIVLVTDDSDANWWKGSTWRGEGLFPASFVTSDLSSDVEDKKSEAKKVQFNETISVKQFDPETVQIDETKIDQALNMIQNADPTGEYEDSPEMLDLEAQCKAMVPLIDQELQRIDRKYNELAQLNRRLTESFQLYSDLMQEAAAAVPQQQPYGAYGGPALAYGGAASVATKGYLPATNVGYAPQPYGPPQHGSLAMPGMVGALQQPSLSYSSLAQAPHPQPMAGPGGPTPASQPQYQPLTSSPYAPAVAPQLQSQYASAQPYTPAALQAYSQASAAGQAPYSSGSVYGTQPAAPGFGQPLQQQLY